MLPKVYSKWVDLTSYVIKVMFCLCIIFLVTIFLAYCLLKRGGVGGFAYYFYWIIIILIVWEIGAVIFATHCMLKLRGTQRKVFSDSEIFHKVDDILRELNHTYVVSKNVKLVPFDKFDKCYDMGSWKVAIRKTKLVTWGGIPMDLVSVGPIIESNAMAVKEFQKKMDEQINPFKIQSKNLKNT